MELGVQQKNIGQIEVHHLDVRLMKGLLFDGFPAILCLSANMPFLHGFQYPSKGDCPQGGEFVRAGRTD